LQVLGGLGIYQELPFAISSNISALKVMGSFLVRLLSPNPQLAIL
jgi:hypothetical protein